MWNRIASVSACVLLGANLALLLIRPAEPRPALGQAASTPDGTAILATVQGSGNEPYFVVYDVPSKRAGAYAIKNGIEIRGIRDLTHDLELQDFSTEKTVSVAVIKAEIESTRRASKSRNDKPGGPGPRPGNGSAAEAETKTTRSAVHGLRLAVAARGSAVQQLSSSAVAFLGRDGAG